MVNYDLYNLLTGPYTSGGTWVQIGTTPQVVPMPSVGAVPANINKEFLLPGTYQFQYTPPPSCGTGTSVTTSLTIKEKPVVSVAPDPLYYCVFNGVAPAAQAITATVTNQSNGGAWSGGALTYAWTNGGTGATINYIPPSPYTAEQLINLGVTASTGAPVCTGTDTTVIRVAQNINTGSPSNTTFCQGVVTPYNLITQNISGNSTPVVSGAGIRLEVQLVSGAASIPINGGGSVTSGSYFNYTQFQALLLNGFSTGTVLTFVYKYFYQFANGVQGCTFTSASFTVTIQTTVTSGTANPQTSCNG